MAYINSVFSKDMRVFEVMDPVPSNGVYHEKQSLQMCLKHALNNLFQGPVFEKEELNQICKE